MKLIIVILFITSISFSQQGELLEKAYKYNSQILLDEFFMNWHNEMPPVTNEELKIQNDTIKAIYELCRFIYKPLNLASISDTDYFWSDEYKGIKYAICGRERIYYSFVGRYKNPYDSLTIIDTTPGFSEGIYREANMYEVFKRDSINNFRPYTYESSGVQTVYLSDNYYILICKFLFGKYSNDYRALYDEEKLTRKETIKRYNFLKKVVSVSPPFTSNWSIDTSPDISVVHFTKDFKKARVRYMIYSGLLEMDFIKDEGLWKYVSHKLVGWWDW